MSEIGGIRVNIPMKHFLFQVEEREGLSGLPVKR